MKELLNMMRVSGKFHDKIKAFCNPLIQNFGVSQFYHAKISNSGHFIGVNLNREWEEYFLSDTSHLLIWPDKCEPFKIKKGIRLLQENEEGRLSQLLTRAKEKYSVNFSLQVVEKSSRGSEMYGFALNSSNPFQHMNLIKEMPLLRLFIKRFQEELKGLYTALDDNRVDMQKLLGPSFHAIKNPAMPKPVMRDQFLKKIGIETPVSLTDREIEIIKYLINACSASEIAGELFISRRTVEHHIERIKDKFFSSSKSELVQKIHELESIGYFMV